MEIKPLTLLLLADAGGFSSELTSITQNEAIYSNIDIFARSSNDNELQNENDDFLEIAIDAEKKLIISRREGTQVGAAWLRLRCLQAYHPMASTTLAAMSPW